MRSDATAPDRMAKVCAGGWKARRGTRSGCHPCPIRLTPAPMLSPWFIRFHGAQGGDMFARRFAD